MYKAKTLHTEWVSVAGKSTLSEVCCIRWQRGARGDLPVAARRPSPRHASQCGNAHAQGAAPHIDIGIAVSCPLLFAEMWQRQECCAASPREHSVRHQKRLPFSSESLLQYQFAKGSGQQSISPPWHSWVAQCYFASEPVVSLNSDNNRLPYFEVCN